MSKHCHLVAWIEGTSAFRATDQIKCNNPKARNIDWPVRYCSQKGLQFLFYLSCDCFAVNCMSPITIWWLRVVDGFLEHQNVKIPEQAVCCATMATPRLTTWYARRSLKKRSNRKWPIYPWEIRHVNLVKPDNLGWHKTFKIRPGSHYKTSNRTANKPLSELSDGRWY